MNLKANVYRAVPFLLIMVNIIVHVDYRLFKAYSPAVAYTNLGMYIWVFAMGRKNVVNIKELVCVFMAIGYAIFASFINGNSIGAIVAYLELFLVGYALSRFSLSKSDKKIMVVTALVISLRYFLEAKTFFEKWTAFPESFVNPNTVGMFMYFTFALFCLTVFDAANRKRKVLVILWMLLIYEEYLLKCRTYMIVSFVLGMFLFIIPIRILYNKKLIKALVVSVVVLGIVFPYVYVLFSTNEQLSILVHQYTGKYLFTGREYTWINFFSYEFSHRRDLLLGAGSWIERTFSDRFSLHNSYLGIIMNFGIIGLGIYVYYLLTVVDIMFQKPVSNKQLIMLITYIGFMIASCSEVVLQTPMSSLLVGIILGLVRAETNGREYLIKEVV